MYNLKSHHNNKPKNHSHAKTSNKVHATNNKHSDSNNNGNTNKIKYVKDKSPKWKNNQWKTILVRIKYPKD